MSVQIQLRRDIASAWTTANPVLALGEIGVEIDTRKLKVGNGGSAWNSLGYILSDPVVHDHDTAYAALGHTHAALYAALAHGHTVASLTDAAITSPVAGQFLRFDGTSWVNYTPGTAGYDITVSVPGSFTSSGGSAKRYLTIAGTITSIRASTSAGVVAPVTVTLNHHAAGVTAMPVTIGTGTSYSGVVVTNTSVAAGDYLTMVVAGSGADLVVTARITV